MFPGIGPARFSKLLAKFETATRAWNATADRLIDAGIGGTLVAEFDKFRNTTNLSEYAEKLKEKQIDFLTFQDTRYPKKLLELDRPPYVLYTVGNQSLFLEEAFAVVGTRTITNYGMEVTRMFTTELVSNGFVIVSGLALGVDACVHQTTLDLQGKTIAVLGCGVDCPNPRENSQLYADIIKSGGLIVSEIPPGMDPNKGSFLARNRIIAGLSLGVLVTEGAEDSGALTTAEYAFKLKRPVFAVPGPITSRFSKGPYKLINKGGKLVTSPEDIIKELKSQTLNSKSSSRGEAGQIKTGTKEEEKILKLLENETLLFDEIVIKTGMDSSRLGSLLTMMEVKGMIKSSGWGFSIVLTRTV